ncbi:MAG: ATP-binding cassette domain-containing protein [Calditerrivibrio sp.]|nr:ATP-binding cassette domain-containing protein [Calditerrivibrio sp.]MCA1932339.1 ATP-binding cassette domain-containing protein [Calditerrivibrio sp.]
MSILSFTNVSKSYGDKLLFQGATFSLMQGKKVALFGDNGSGKSTIVKILVGIEEADSGKIIISNSVKIGYLDQITNEHGTIFDYMLNGNKELLAIEIEMENCENPAKLTELYDEFEKKGGNFYKSTIREVLSAFGFRESEWGRDVSILSGGELERLKLARLLSSDANLLVLDEPTNYLDIIMIEWLEQFLKNTDKTVLFVSHDRKILENIAEEILYISNKTITHYKMGLKKFIDVYQKNMDLLLTRKERLEEEKIRLMEFIDKYRAGIKSKQVNSRMNNLKKVEEELKNYQFEWRNVDFSFRKKREENYEVVRGEDIILGYGDTILTKKFSFTVYKGEKVALIGKNGSGKSTLLKSICGIESIMSGKLILGDRVEFGYFEQIYRENLDKTVFEELIDIDVEMTFDDIYNILPRFGMGYEYLNRKLFSLSGGELSKISLIKLYFLKPNLLVLDEPTNHLDYETVEVLKNALVNYNGTIIMVSHDRYFMERLVDKFIFFDNGEVSVTQYYPLLKDGLKEKSVGDISSGKVERSVRKKVDKYKINALEKSIFELENYLNSLYKDRDSCRSDWEKLDQCNKKIEEVENELLDKYAEMENLNQEER